MERNMRWREISRPAVIPAMIRAGGFMMAATVLFFGCGGPGSGGGNPETADPIALVGDRTVTEQAFQAYLVDVFGSEDEVQDSDELLSRLLDQYLEEQILLDRALQMELQADEEEVQLFLETRAPRLEEFEPVERDRFLRNVRDSILAKKLKEMVIAERVEITREEIEQYYNDDPERFHRSTRIQLRQILVDDRDKAEKLLGELVEAPSRFQEVAEVHSEAPDRGLTGSYDEEGLPAEIQTAIADLRDGEISAIVQDSQGFHLFQLVGREADQELPLEEVHKDIETILLREKSERALEEYTLELRQEIALTIVEENLDFEYIERE
jgi:parvulin-like peptidyl-prolyl isomerase